MLQEIKNNFIEKLHLVCSDLLDDLDRKVKVMFAEHSRDKLLQSGATIKKTMGFIAEGNANLYREALDYCANLNITYYTEYESEINELVSVIQNKFKEESLKRLHRATEIARSENLYEKMAIQVETNMVKDLAEFKNALNFKVLKLKSSSTSIPIVRVFLFLEILLIMVSLFVVWLWFKNPSGNYEPVLVGLGLFVPIVEMLRRSNK